MSEEKKLKAVKTATKFNGKGSITITLNGHATKTEDVYILDEPDNSLMGVIGEEKGIVVVQFSSLTGPGTYGIKEYGIWIYMAFSGFVGAAATGSLTLDTIEVKNKYKGHFDVKTIDHQKIDGVFDVWKI